MNGQTNKWQEKSPSEEGRKELSTAQKLSREIYRVCIGHTMRDAVSAIEMFQLEMDRLARITDSRQETAPAPGRS